MLYADENIPLKIVQRLRSEGYCVDSLLNSYRMIWLQAMPLRASSSPSTNSAGALPAWIGRNLPGTCVAFCYTGGRMRSASASGRKAREKCVANTVPRPCRIGGGG